MTAKTIHRSDTEMFAEARRALDRHSTIPATVHVHVENGTATLTGIVRVASESADAIAVVRAVPGIARVINKLTVTQVVGEDEAIRSLG